MLARTIPAALAFLILAAPPAAMAKKRKHSCRTPNSSVSTLAVRGMECGDGRGLIKRLFREHPGGDGVALGQKRTFKVLGWAGSPGKTQHTFRCTVLYTNGTGNNAGGVMLKVHCVDFDGNATYYTEQQDGE